MLDISLPLLHYLNMTSEKQAFKSKLFGSLLRLKNTKFRIHLSENKYHNKKAHRNEQEYFKTMITGWMKLSEVITAQSSLKVMTSAFFNHFLKR